MNVHNKIVAYMTRIVHYIFNDKKKLVLLLNLRSQGLSYEALRLIFSCDKKAVRYQCNAYGVEPIEETHNIGNPVIYIAKELEKWRYIDGEMINMGRKYKDYFRSPIKDKHLI